MREADEDNEEVLVFARADHLVLVDLHGRAEPSATSTQKRMLRPSVSECSVAVPVTCPPSTTVAVQPMTPASFARPKVTSRTGPIRSRSASARSSGVSSVNDGNPDAGSGERSSGISVAQRRS